MNSIRILLICVFIPSLPALCQSGELHGTVVSGTEPVAFANIILKGTTRGAVSDSEGHFNITQVPYGTYTIVLSSVGYVTLQKSIRIGGPSLHEKFVMNEDVSTLNEVVVTGTMKEVTKLQSPIPVEVYSPVLFRKNPTSNIFESMNMINGVQPQLNCNVCNTGDIHINGLEGPYTMVLIDGMPIVSSLSTVYGLSGIPNSIVKRIEVVKGPASTLYGSEAVGGLINIITKDPGSAPKYQADVFGTSVGEMNADLSTRFMAGRASSLVGVNAFNFGTLWDINHDNFTDVTLQKRISVFNKWTLPTRTGKSSSIAWRYFTENRWGGELQWTEGDRGTDRHYGESIYTKRWEVIGEHPLSRNENLTLNYSYNFHHQDSYYGTVKYLADQHVGFFQMRYNKRMGRHDLLFGSPLRYIFYNDNTPGTTSTDGTDQPSVTILPGIFVQDEMELSKRTSLLAGARYDHHNVHGSIFTPRLSFKHNFTQNSVFRITAGSGFRVVNLFTEDHAALTGARTVVIKNALKPERSWNLNLNYTKNFVFGDGFVTLDGSMFYTYFENKIVGDFLSDPDKIIYDNLNGDAVSKGLTINSDFNLSNNWKFLFGATWMDVYRIDNSSAGSQRIPQLQAPRFSGVFTAGYTFRDSKWSVDLTGRVNGPMYLPVQENDFRPDKSPLYALVNLQFTRQLIGSDGSKWEIYGGVKNLLNFIPSDPLMRPFDPFDRNVTTNNPNGYTFDTAYNYAPMQGMKGFLGIRYTIM